MTRRMTAREALERYALNMTATEVREREVAYFKAWGERKRNESNPVLEAWLDRVLILARAATKI